MNYRKEISFICKNSHILNHLNTAGLRRDLPTWRQKLFCYDAFDVNTGVQYLLKNKIRKMSTMKQSAALILFSGKNKA